ncbi:MAG: hypothetical protein N3A01_01450 [Bacteroidales bacterium]|nr:hypothetical protein [Bacteroidales bacterium]
MNCFIYLLFYILLILLCSYKCKNQESCKKNSIIKNIIVDRNFDYSYNKHAYKIKEINIKDSILSVIFTANICPHDEVDLVYNGMILKSLPPKVQLGLRFNENPKCKNSEIKRAYNVGSLKQHNTNKIILLFTDYPPVEYSY